ncbi:MAG: T9SS type A sorting domain-containing protein [Bacteroidetes bacterium]|nr:T9SS type A sorting domain-containing protein [Bacteroidota bacterium]
MPTKNSISTKHSRYGFSIVCSLLMVMLCSSATLRAQSAASYTFSAFNATYNALAGTSLPTIQQNNHDTTISLGFNFNFAGGTYSNVTVSSNGQLSFNPFVANDLDNKLLTADSIGPMLMPLWDDVSGDSATATYSVTGTAPNRVFKMEYSGWRWSSSAASNAISMEVSLYETDNIIDFQYSQGPTAYDLLGGGATIGIFNNTGDWQTLPDASTNPTPSSTSFTTSITQKPASGQVYRWSPPVAAATNSFSVVTYDNCTNPQFVANTATYTPGMGVKTYYGDTYTDSAAVTSGNFGGHAVFNHAYATSGTYTIKMILYSGAAAVDSVQFSYVHAICNTMYIGFFYDDNGNCSRDAGEADILQPSLTEVDSNGTPVDTIPATSGFYYTAYGSVGDIYDFKPISMGPDLFVHCPGTGVISNTLTITNNIAPKYFAIECANGSYFDLAVSATTTSGRHTGLIDMLVSNSYCAPKNSNVTLTFDGGYAYNTSTPPATSHTGTTAVWDINALSALTTPTPNISCHIETPLTWFVIGVPVDYMITVTPTTGDADTTNNTVIIHDTITGAFDPNHIQVNPDGHIAAGTKLTYSVEFENTGNDTATNIYVMDTIPAELDFSSLQIKAASGVMDVVKYTAGGYNIIKFDFPNVNLPDSVHHPENCTGMFTYTINAKNGLPDGTLIQNHAGIYFDNNEVVLTNTTENIIGLPTGVSVLNKERNVDMFPNPVTNQLTIKVTQGSYSSLTITNALGRVMLHQQIGSAVMRVNTSSLPAGLYYISFAGAQGTETRKFVKL